MSTVRVVAAAVGGMLGGSLNWSLVGWCLSDYFWGGSPYIQFAPKITRGRGCTSGLSPNKINENFPSTVPFADRSKHFPNFNFFFLFSFLRETGIPSRHCPSVGNSLAPWLLLN